MGVGWGGCCCSFKKVCECVCVSSFFSSFFFWGGGGGGVVACFCFLLYSCKELGLNFGRRKTNTLTCQRDRKEITKGQADL